MVDSWGDDNFPKAERAKARAAMEDTKEAAAKVVLAEAVAAVGRGHGAQAGAARGGGGYDSGVPDRRAGLRRAGNERLQRKRGQRGPEEEQEVGEDGNTRPKNSRKVNIDGAEAEQNKADRKSRPPKGGAADGIPDRESWKMTIGVWPTHEGRSCARSECVGAMRGAVARGPSLNSGVAPVPRPRV